MPSRFFIDVNRMTTSTDESVKYILLTFMICSSFTHHRLCRSNSCLSHRERWHPKDDGEGYLFHLYTLSVSYLCDAHAAVARTLPPLCGPPSLSVQARLRWLLRSILLLLSEAIK